MSSKECRRSGRFTRFSKVLGDRMGGYFREFWRSAQRPEVFRRCVVIAVVVGTLLTLVNEFDAIFGSRSDPGLAWRVGANYVIPFVVSNLGAMSSDSKP